MGMPVMVERSASGSLVPMVSVIAPGMFFLCSLLLIRIAFSAWVERGQLNSKLVVKCAYFTLLVNMAAAVTDTAIR